MKIVSPWFLWFLFMAGVITTATLGFLLSLTPFFVKAAVYLALLIIVLVGGAFALDDVICGACDIPQQRYYGVLFGFSGAVILGAIFGVGVIFL